MPFITEDFEGADLDRLNDCIKAVHKAGLKIGKYTQAGVNQSSGNVWVWDEYWAGCVYCSIGFDIAWSYNCPECGAETDFDTYKELENYAKAHEYANCDECVAV